MKTSAHQYPQERAFSLVELSIVLVILGLLVGGVLAGQSLIRAAELRKTMTYVTEMRTAWMSFKDKYFQMPGDMTNATSFWGRTNATAGWQNGACPADPGTPSATGTCNGNGDGYVSYYSSYERNLVYDHLKQAGLIAYPVNNAIAYYTQAPGLKTGVISLIANNNSSPASIVYMSYYGVSLPNGINARGVGLRLATFGSASNDLLGAVISPTELWNIDTKMDDGKPDAGLMYGFNGTNGTAGVWYTTCITASGSSYVYELTESAPACQALFALEKR